MRHVNKLGQRYQAKRRGYLIEYFQEKGKNIDPAGTLWAQFC